MHSSARDRRDPLRIGLLASAAILIGATFPVTVSAVQTGSGGAAAQTIETRGAYANVASVLRIGDRLTANVRLQQAAATSRTARTTSRDLRAFVTGLDRRLERSATALRQRQAEEAVATARARAAERIDRAEAQREAARRIAREKEQREAAALEAARKEAARKEAVRKEAAAAERAKARAAAAARQSAPAAGGSGGSTNSAAYSGRNHMWYPALGINQPVGWFPCDRAAAPDNYVYRWGCAGSNNVYLLGHAWGKFAALNRAYYNGGLAQGQLVVYADNDGRIHYFRLAWLKTYPPVAEASWAWAGQSQSSLTLQTCVGSNSEERLFVRFTEVAAP
ncbi:MAG: hypothetical protein ACR2JZ_01020 [Candidatus Limnocylindrales bacterium]